MSAESMKGLEVLQALKGHNFSGGLHKFLVASNQVKLSYP